MPGDTFGAEPAAPVAVEGGMTATPPAAPAGGWIVVGGGAVVAPVPIIAGRPAVLIRPGEVEAATPAVPDDDTAPRPAALAPATALGPCAPALDRPLGSCVVAGPEVPGEHAAATRHNIEMPFKPAKSGPKHRIRTSLNPNKNYLNLTVTRG